MPFYSWFDFKWLIYIFTESEVESDDSCYATPGNRNNNKRRKSKSRRGQSNFGYVFLLMFKCVYIKRYLDLGQKPPNNE